VTAIKEEMRPWVAVALGLLALALAACGTNRHAAVVTTAPTCRATAISISFVPNLGVALGNRHGTAVIRNVGANTCAVRGYLGLRLLGFRRRVQTTHVARGGTYFQLGGHQRTVTLRPNARAIADVAWGIEPSHGEASVLCEPRSRWIEISLPSAHKRSVVPFVGDRVCGHGRLFTTALVRAAKAPR
jgi:hypothetical protein